MKVPEFILGAMLTVVLSVQAWMAVQIVDLKIAVARIEERAVKTASGSNNHKIAALTLSNE